MWNEICKRPTFSTVVLAVVMGCTGCSAKQSVEEDYGYKTRFSDIEGVWQIENYSGALMPVNGTVPLNEDGMALVKEHQAWQHEGTREAYDNFDITMSRCSLPGVPRVMNLPGRFKVWDRLGVLTFDYEWNRAIRQVDMSGKDVTLPLVPNMNGVSSGKWSEDELVITTVDVSDRTLIDNLLPHSMDMKVTERLRLEDENTLVNHITIDDPVYYQEPWEAVVIYKRQPDAIFSEDICMDRLEQGELALPVAGDKL